MSQVMTEPLPTLYRNEQAKHTFKHNHAHHRHTHSDRFICAYLYGGVICSIYIVAIQQSGCRVTGIGVFLGSIRFQT